jgi:hypothetical protein
VQGANFFPGLAVSLCPIHGRVNENTKPRFLLARQASLVFSEQFLGILEEADEYNHGRPHKADEEHDFEHPHGEKGQLHGLIVTRFRLARNCFGAMW